MTHSKSTILIILIGVLSGVLAAAPAGADSPHAGMMRYPDIGPSHIVFLYANDLWLVPREGGTAMPLAGPDGAEQFPKFSPDGQTIAFVGNYDGDVDLYTVPVAGGVPHRVTHHPTTEMLCDWSPNDELVFFAGGMGFYPRARELWKVDADGGLPVKLPVPYGARAAISADGDWLAYTPHTRDQRTWKRYRGGMATDIWLFHLSEHTSKKITDWEGTDTMPMWHGDSVYYLSDAGPNHRLNLWVYNTISDERRQITTFDDYDVKWPSIGPGPDGDGEIVFQHGTDLQVLDLASKGVRTVEVDIPGARPHVRPQRVDSSELIFNRNISSTGQRAVVGARGDIWTLPAANGTARNLTRTAGVAERDPAWSPDGQWVAYFSDASGEYQLVVRQSDGRGDERVLSDRQSGFLFSPVWSPDSKHITFWDQTGTLFLATVANGTVTEIDQEPWSDISSVSWSHDSGWVAYTKAMPSNPNTRAVWLYDMRESTTHQVTAGRFADSWPAFDREGRYLFFASSRDFTDPIYEDVGTTFVYADTERLIAVPLRADVPPPDVPESDEEEWMEEDDNGATDEAKPPKGRSKKGKGKDEADDDDGDEDDNEEIEPLKIDLEGFEQRAVLLPADRGSFRMLNVNDKGQLVYVRDAAAGVSGKPAVMLLDLDADDKKPSMPPRIAAAMGGGSPDDNEGGDGEQTVLAGVGAYQMSADGTKLLVWMGPRMAIVDAKPKQKMKDTIATDDLRSTVDPRAEWAQIFNDAWRIQRDFFYDPNMHGVDWPAVREQYAAMLDHCASREDVSYVIREMISEINVGHAYYFGGDEERAEQVPVGLPGCDFELDNGAYRIASILRAGPWDLGVRSPLDRSALDVADGDYLLAVNGTPVDTTKDPWAAFIGLAGDSVVLTVSSKPQLDDDARNIVVELASSEAELRYWAWVENRRQYVAERSNGRVGYIYVPNTGVEGQNHLFRQFYGQVDAPALIVDERWNGGGQIPTRFIELLNRPVANYWALRDAQNDATWPPDAHHGPKCMLINGLAGSGGDYFPFYFREVGLGKLVGTRTWGGLVGISFGPRLVDGGITTAPSFAFYETDGTWGIEGHGVDPDIEVLDDPSKMQDGADPQLDAAIELMLSELETNPYVKPNRPAYPDRSGMGIREEDK